jgi:hypothetical protein
VKPEDDPMLLLLPYKGGGEERSTFGRSSGAGQEHVRSKEHPTTSVTEVIAEAARQREAAISRRREIRATARRDFADARKVGLQKRHASRLREADTTGENT